MSDRYQRVPIYQDHQARRPFDMHGHTSVFDDMRRQMGDWGADPLTHQRTYRVRPFGMGLDEEFDNMCKDFFELKPRNPLLSNIRGDSGSRESLDEDKVIHSDSQGSSRKFQVSFDVKDYEPQDISVKVDKDTLVVEAKRETIKDGSKSSKQFSRNVHLPSDVDPDKLVSSLSNDGILTLEAPIPPHYQSLTGTQKQSIASPSRPSYGTPSSTSSSHETTSSQESHYPAHISTSSYQSPASFTSYHQQPTTCTTTNSGYNMPPPPAYPGPKNDPPPQPSYPAPPPPLPKANNTPPPQAAAADAELAPETPTFSDTPQGRRLDLIVELGKPYTSDDIVVKLEGRQLQVEAEHVEKSRKAKSCMSREFDLDEDIDPRTVQANFDDSGRLIIAAMVAQKEENGS